MQTAIKKFIETGDRDHLLFFREAFNNKYNQYIDEDLFKFGLKYAEFFYDEEDIFDGITPERIMECVKECLKDNDKLVDNFIRVTPVIRDESDEESDSDEEEISDDEESDSDEEEISKEDLHDEIDHYFERYLSENVGTKASYSRKIKEILSYTERLKKKISQFYPQK